MTNDYYKQWYEENKERKLEQNKAWKAANIEKVRAYDREYKRRVRNEAKQTSQSQEASPENDTQVKTA